MDAAPPSPPTEGDRTYRVGDLVGRKYELERLLGEGGMGSVWCARNLSLDSLVALKLLRPDGESDSEGDGDRLLQEARAAARLGHRAIVRVFDFGHTEKGDPFIVMELLEGESLAAALKSRSRLNAMKSVQTLLPIVEALAVAHAEGIVHRDLKPENIFLAKEARRIQPKVVDFGIAKVERGGFTKTLTRKGAILGSPGYMSPEQARGLAAIDHRADIWALCLVLYECMTGRSPFEGENYNALMRAIIEDPVTPSTAFSAGDDALWAIIARGLQKNPEARWPSMRELGGALARWLLSHGVEQDVSGDSLAGSTTTEEPTSDPPSPNDPAVDASLIRLRSETQRRHASPLLARPARAAAWVAGGGALLGALWWASASHRGLSPPASASLARPSAPGAAAPSTQMVAPQASVAPVAPTEVAPRAAPTTVPSAARAQADGRRAARESHPQRAPLEQKPTAPAPPPAQDLKDPYGSVP